MSVKFILSNTFGFSADNMYRLIAKNVGNGRQIVIVPDKFSLAFERNIPAHDCKRVLRASGKARAEPIAVTVRNHSRLTVDDRNGTFRTVQHALAAAVAAFLVDMNDPSFHIFASRLCLRSAAASSFCFAAIFIICSYISSPTH